MLTEGRKRASRALDRLDQSVQTGHRGGPKRDDAPDGDLVSDALVVRDRPLEVRDRPFKRPRPLGGLAGERGELRLFVTGGGDLERLFEIRKRLFG